MNKVVNAAVADLIGPALDWAVAVALGHQPRTGEGCAAPVEIVDWNRPDTRVNGCRFAPSTDWAQGGPLLEDLKPDLYFEHFDDLDRPTGVWFAELEYKGPTLLVATCRAFVADKLGGVVSVPQELVKEAQHG